VEIFGEEYDAEIFLEYPIKKTYFFGQMKSAYPV
jgi:hypothetical protein